ncbi:hypothetical protein RhiJN_06791 [Ceratobasidium sp. AG-Ba]|nr:hypothetical protein RhiJN_06791 [Ceratobasidium sp. AG-Ba]
MEQSISALEFDPDHTNSGTPNDVPLVQQEIAATHDSQEPEESEDMKQFKILIFFLRDDRKTDKELVNRKMLEAASILRGRNAIVVLAREALNDWTQANPPEIPSAQERARRSVESKLVMSVAHD